MRQPFIYVFVSARNRYFSEEISESFLILADSVRFQDFSEFSSDELLFFFGKDNLPSL